VTLHNRSLRRAWSAPALQTEALDEDEEDRMQPEGTAVVTGASRGIGLGVALELARRGFDTLATMRDPEVDVTFPPGRRRGSLRATRLDVTDPGTIQLPETLTVLVNNAGVEAPHPAFEDTELDLWRAMYETNVFGLVEVTRRAIPALRAAGGGVVCNVTSSSILAPVPFYAPYRSSKAAVSAIGESLRAELAPLGIRVLEIMPGPVATDMFTGSGRPPEAIERPEYRAVAERYHEGRHGIEAMVTSVDEASRAIVDAILDDDAPLRVGCDPLSVGMLDAWRSQTDEEFQRSMLPAWTGAT
jgi:NAD(P)-dependent dehydrogenase (short-subunit alcohol dehydrogenase family)